MDLVTYIGTKICLYVCFHSNYCDSAEILNENGQLIEWYKLGQ